MLKRPNPYRKSRAAGTLDDLMFDMDKRRHTSFRFQNYQNFITDRPGKFDERYRQKLSWCALDEETGALDYLTEGLSPNGGRRMSTSSVGSSKMGGGGGGGDRDRERDSLTSNQGQRRHDSADSNGSGDGRSGGDGDAAFSSTRGEDPAGGFTSPPRCTSPPSMSSSFISPPREGGGGTPKPPSGRSWKAPQFAIDDRDQGVLLEHSPVHHDRLLQQQQRRAAAANAEGSPHLGGARSLSPVRNNVWAGPSLTAGAAGTGGLRRSTSSSSSGRRSSASSFSLGTGSVRGPGSWTRSSAGDRSSTSTASSKVSGAGSGKSSLDESAKEPDSGAAAAAAAAAAATAGAGAGAGDDAAFAKMEGASPIPRGGREARAMLSPAQENDEAEEGEEEVSSPEGLTPRKLLGDVGDDAEHGDIITGDSAVGGAVGCAGDGGGVAAAVSDTGREASFGTVSSTMFLSGADGAGGSLQLRSSNNFPRKSEESTYFESNASTATAMLGTHVGSVGGSVGLTASTGKAPTSAMELLRGGGLGVAEDDQENQHKEDGEEEEAQCRKIRGVKGEPTTREGAVGSPDGREPLVSKIVVVSTTDPAVLVRPPRVGDGKLKHDKERRLGVTSDLEAVIAELGRRKSLLAWEDGEGAASDSGESPVRQTGEGRASADTKGRHDEEGEPHLSSGSLPSFSAGGGAFEREGGGDTPEPVEVTVASADAGGPANAEAETIAATSGAGKNDSLNEPAASPTKIVEPGVVPADGAALGDPVLTASALRCNGNITPHSPSTRSMPQSRTPRSAGASVAAPAAVVSPSAPPRAVCGAAAAAAASSNFGSSSSSTNAELGLARKSTGATAVMTAAADASAAPVAVVAVEVVGGGQQNATGDMTVMNKSRRVQQMPALSGSSESGMAVAAQSKKTAGESGRRIKPSSAPPPAPHSAASRSTAFGGGRPRATAAMAVASARARSPRAAVKATVTSANPASAPGAISGYRAPTKSSKARVGSGDGGGGGENNAGSSGALTGSAASSPASVAAPSQQRAHHRKAQQKQSPRGKEERCSRGRGRARDAGDRVGSGSRKGRRLSSSAPPPELREGGCASRVRSVGTDIVTPSDFVTSAQECGEGAPPLSGVPVIDHDVVPAPPTPEAATAAAVAAPRSHRRSVSAGVLPRSADEEVMDPALELSGVRTMGAVAAATAVEGKSVRATGRGRGRARGKSVSDRRVMASAGGASAAASPRKGKYQVKDSFNRLKGWINGGFTGNSGARKNGNQSPVTAMVKGSPGVPVKPWGASTTASSNRALNHRSGDRRSSSAVAGRRASSTTPHGGGGGGGKGSADSRNLAPNPAVDRAAARVEARRAAEREALKAARAADAAAAAKDKDKAGTAKSSSSSATAASANAKKRRKSVSKAGGVGTTKKAVKPVASVTGPLAESRAAAVGGNDTRRGRPQVRGLEVATAGSSSSPSPSPTSISSRKGSRRSDELASAAVAEAAAGAAAASAAAAAGAGAVPRKCKAVPASAARTAAAAIALSPASARMSVVAPAASPAGPAARVKTRQAARALGATVPGLSSASSPRLGRNRVPVESKGPMRSPRIGGGGGGGGGGVGVTYKSPRSGGFSREGGFFGGRGGGAGGGNGKSPAVVAGTRGGEASGSGSGNMWSPRGIKAVVGGGGTSSSSGSRSASSSTPKASKERQPGKSVRAMV